MAGWGKCDLGGAEPCDQGTVNALREQRDCEREGSEEAATQGNKGTMEKKKCKNRGGFGMEGCGGARGNNRGRRSRRELGSEIEIRARKSSKPNKENVRKASIRIKNFPSMAFS